jgi:signal transduction histidine kinase
MGMETIANFSGGEGGRALRRLLPRYAENAPLLGYVLGVWGVGCALALLFGGSLAGLFSVPFFLWFAISLGAEMLWLETLSGDATDSMASAVNFAVIFLYGRHLSLWIIGLSVFLATALIQKRDWVHSLFGFGQMVITALLAAFAFRLGHAGGITLESYRHPLVIASMILSGVVYFFANTFLVARAVSLERRIPFWATWRQNYGYRNSIVSTIALFSLSPLLILSFLSLGYPGVLLFFLPLLIIKNQNREYINLQKMTQALISSERMAAKGEMAAEVAHEINNYLAVLSGRTQLLLMRAGRAGNQAMCSDAEIIRQQIGRMSTLAKGLLDFSHKEIRVEPFDLNKLVRDTIEFVRPQNLFDGIELVPEIDPELGEVQADGGQMQQVLINLLRNAADAMRDQRRKHAAPDAKAEPEKGEEPAASGEGNLPETAAPASIGRITVRTARASHGQVGVSVQDNGPGIAKQNMPRIFEPAFTTKPDGHGYGLATCYRILQNHGGRIWVESEPGEGAIFRMEFPRKSRVEGDEVGVNGGAPEPEPPLRNGDIRAVADEEERELGAGGI